MIIHILTAVIVVIVVGILAISLIVVGTTLTQVIVVGILAISLIVVGTTLTQVIAPGITVTLVWTLVIVVTKVQYIMTSQ